MLVTTKFRPIETPIYSAFAITATQFEDPRFAQSLSTLFLTNFRGSPNWWNLIYSTSSMFATIMFAIGELTTSSSTHVSICYISIINASLSRPFRLLAPFNRLPAEITLSLSNRFAPKFPPPCGLLQSFRPQIFLITLFFTITATRIKKPRLSLSLCTHYLTQYPFSNKFCELGRLGEKKQGQWEYRCIDPGALKNVASTYRKPSKVLSAPAN